MIPMTILAEIEPMLRSVGLIANNRECELIQVFTDHLRRRADDVVVRLHAAVTNAVPRRSRDSSITTSATYCQGPIPYLVVTFSNSWPALYPLPLAVPPAIPLIREPLGSQIDGRPQHVSPMLPICKLTAVAYTT